ncbi:MAG TPA: hypothetical protein VNN17_07300, partial [Terriglobia bacterium]|nr:hypothetical protein [Terriglobia bacterium]
MNLRNTQRNRALWFALLPVFLLAAAIALSGGGVGFSTNWLLHSGPRLVSVRPLPALETEGPFCQWLPAAASQPLLAALWQSPTPAPSTDPGPRNLIRDRAPL